MRSTTYCSASSRKVTPVSQLTVRHAHTRRRTNIASFPVNMFVFPSTYINASRVCLWGAHFVCGNWFTQMSIVLASIVEMAFFKKASTNLTITKHESFVYLLPLFQNSVSSDKSPVHKMRPLLLLSNSHPNLVHSVRCSS